MNPRKVSDEMHKMGVVPVGWPLAFYLAHVLGLSPNSFILLDFVDVWQTLHQILVTMTRSFIGAVS